MSFQALNWAVRQRVGTPVGKGILMALANYADEKGTCFPSHERLARETELSDKSVRVHLKRFEDLHMVAAHRERDDAGRLGIIRYSLALDRDFDFLPEETRGKRKAKLPADKPENEAATSGDPVAAGTTGLVEAGTGGSPPVSEGDSPPVSEGTSNPSKNNPLSLPSQNTREVKNSTSREVAFQLLLRPAAEGGYPPEAVDDDERARSAWANVAEAEWQEAVDAIPRFLRARKDINRGTLIGLEKYIRDTKWRGFPQPKAAEGGVPAVELKPYVR